MSSGYRKSQKPHEHRIFALLAPPCTEVHRAPRCIPAAWHRIAPCTSVHQASYAPAPRRSSPILVAETLALSDKREATFLGSDFLGLQSFTPARLCCQAVKMARALASPALLLSAHLGPCTGTCVPCTRGPEWLCLGPGLTCLSLPRATAACPACAEVRD